MKPPGRERRPPNIYEEPNLSSPQVSSPTKLPAAPREELATVPQPGTHAVQQEDPHIFAEEAVELQKIQGEDSNTFQQQNLLSLLEDDSATFRESHEMVEPIAQASAEVAQSSVAASDDSTRGRPYYEKLRRDLKQTIAKKQENDKALAAIEANIATLENNYLENTSPFGNIIKGFDNYIKASTTSASASAAAGAGTATRRKAGVSDQDRIFSRSSVSWINRDSPAPLIITNSNANATPSGGATPSASNLQSGAATPNTGAGATTKAGNKNKKKSITGKDKEKEKDNEDADGDGERPAKRGKVSWSRD